MLKLIVLAVAVLVLLGLIWLAPILARRQQQRRFMRKTLAGFRRPTDRRIIVSLSTIPDRINQLQPTLCALLRQTVVPDEIVIALPDFSIREQKPYIVPKYLERFPCVRILRCGNDWGPATKFIPIIQEELAAGRKETLIMVVDDDRACPRDGVESYLHYHAELPDAALSFRGAAMPRSMDWGKARMIYASDIRAPQQVAVITGNGSYLIQPRFFDESLWDYPAPIPFYNDDIWISAYLSLRGVQRYVVPASAMMRNVLRQRWTVSHNQVPNRQDRNNQDIAHFRDAWDVFAPVNVAAE